MVMRLRTAKALFSGTDGKIEAKLPERIAGRITVIEREYLTIIKGVEQQVALDAQQIERGKRGGNNAQIGTLCQYGVPDRHRIRRAAENLVPAFASIARARDRHWAAKQGRRSVAEIIEVTNAGHMTRKEIDRDRSLQRKIVQIVVEDQRRISTDHRGRQHVMRRAAAVDDHPTVGTGAIQDAIVDEMAVRVQERRIGAFARRELRHIARGRMIKDGGCVRTDKVQFAQPRYVHQPRAGTDRDMIVGEGLRVGPGGRHADPVFELRPECPVALGERGLPPGCCHRPSPLACAVSRHFPS